MANKIQYIDNVSGDHVFPVTHERGVRDSRGVNLESKMLRPLAEWHLNGAGNTLVNIQFTDVMPGHTYRFLIKAWPNDEVTQKGSNNAQCAIYNNSVTSENRLAGAYGAETIQDYYDVTAPANCGTLILAGRVNTGEDGIAVVEDITDIIPLVDGVENATAYSFGVIAPDMELDNTYFNASGVIKTDSTTRALRKYAVAPGERYRFSGYRIAGQEFFFVAWYNENEEYIGKEPYVGSANEITQYVNMDIVAPAGAAYAYLNVQKSSASSHKFSAVASREAQQNTLSDIATLKNKVGDVPVSTSSVLPTYAAGYIAAEDGSVVSNANFIYASVALGGAKRVRFIGPAPAVRNSFHSGYAFYDASGECLESHKWDYGNNVAKEYIVDIPTGAVTFKTSLYSSASSNNLWFPRQKNFYCWLQSGENVADKMKVVDQLKEDTTAYTYPLMEYEVIDKAVNNNGAISSGSNAYYKIYKYAVTGGQSYRFSCRTKIRLTYYVINWFDSEGNFISHQFQGSMTKSYTYDKRKITAPANAAYLYMNVVKQYSATYAMYEYGDVVTAQEMYDEISNIKAGRNSLRLLCIGNSYAQDALAYVPYIVDAMGTPFNLTIGLLMLSNSTVNQHLDNFENENAAYTFFYHPGGDTAWSNLGTKSIQWALETYEWDIIMTQSSSGSTPEEYIGKVNKLFNEMYTVLGYPVSFAWLTSHQRPSFSDGSNRTDEQIVSGLMSTLDKVKQLMEHSAIDMMIPVGTAIQNARSIVALKALGDYADVANNTSGYGYLCPADGNHLQQGLPRQIAAYTVIVTLLNHMGLSVKSIFGETTRVDAEWLEGKNTPGGSNRGTATGSDDDNCRMAQLCAMMAHKNPYEVTDMNPIVNPTY